MKKILRNKKGVTLIELIVGMVLFTIITTSITAVMVPMLRNYAKANELAECNTLLDNVANQIISDISVATAPVAHTEFADIISITVDSPGDVTYTVIDGLLQKNGAPVLAKSYYKNKSVSFSCKPAASAEGTAYILTVIIISDTDGEMIRRDYAVRPLVLNQY